MRNRHLFLCLLLGGISHHLSTVTVSEVMSLVCVCLSVLQDSGYMQRQPIHLDTEHLSTTRYV